jgi:hypothetical protein
MERMVEIGLTGLTHILKGGVRIEKNRMLCFVNTISWESIVTEKYHQNIHIEVRQTNLFLSLDQLVTKNQIPNSLVLILS